MPKLFVALDLPATICDLLGGLMPSGSGIRRTVSSDIHLTLHYIGEGSTEDVVIALLAVRTHTFDLTLEGLGTFDHAGDQQTVWAAVLSSAALNQLHRDTSAALSAIGFQPESRAYTPHVSLARCCPAIPIHELPQLQRMTFDVTSFSLYSSNERQAVGCYQREQTFHLRV